MAAATSSLTKLAHKPNAVVADLPAAAVTAAAAAAGGGVEAGVGADGTGIAGIVEIAATAETAGKPTPDDCTKGAGREAAPCGPTEKIAASLK